MTHEKQTYVDTSGAQGVQHDNGWKVRSTIGIRIQATNKLSIAGPSRRLRETLRPQNHRCHSISASSSKSTGVQRDQIGWKIGWQGGWQGIATVVMILWHFSQQISCLLEMGALLSLFSLSLLQGCKRQQPRKGQKGQRPSQWQTSWPLHWWLHFVQLCSIAMRQISWVASHDPINLFLVAMIVAGQVNGSWT